MQDGMATALLLVAIMVLLPLIIRLFALGSLSAPLPIVMLVGSAGLLVLVGFHIHRALETAFHEVFVAPAVPLARPPASAGPQDDLFTPVDVETPALRDGQHEPVGRQTTRAATPTSAAEAEAEEAVEHLWRILEERVANLRNPGQASNDEQRPQRSESD